jgi:hypothetical protein
VRVLCISTRIPRVGKYEAAGLSVMRDLDEAGYVLNTELVLPRKSGFSS